MLDFSALWKGNNEVALAGCVLSTVIANIPVVEFVRGHVQSKEKKIHRVLRRRGRNESKRMLHEQSICFTY